MLHRSLFFAFVAAVLCGAASSVPARAAETAPPTAKASGAPLTEVAHFDHYQCTGIAVSKSGRIFVNFPLWDEHAHRYAVVELMPDGSTKPFPDETWNSWSLKDPDVGNKWVCVQSVVVDENDALWVLDPGNPLQQGTRPGAPKLVKIDLKTNAVAQTIPFGADICPAKSYLNDVRFDLANNVAYISESGVGSIVVVDLKTGKARRTLDEDKSVLLEKNISLTVNGKEVMTAEGKKPQFNIDGITLSPDGAYVYYQALMGSTLYRVPTAVLRDEKAGKSEQSKAVEKVATIFPCDGYWMDKKGNLYLSDLRGGAIQRRTPDGKIELVAADPRIQWPDSFAEGPDGSLYFTCSHIHHMAQYNGGVSARTEPYRVFKIQPR